MSFGISSSLLPVRIGPTRGEPFSAGLFLRHASTASGDREGLGSRLNEPGVHFLPISRDGEVEMFHLGAIASVECRETLPELERLQELGAHGEPAELTLVNEETIRGRLTVIAPPGERRLSDLLNRAEPFLLVVTRRAAVYVNRGAILRVRPDSGKAPYRLVPAAEPVTTG